MNEILQEIKKRLETLYGGRLKGLVLYGSEARGDAADDSDIDILALLEGPVNAGLDIIAAVDATYDLQLDIPTRPIHIMPVDRNDYEAGEFSFFRIVKREGVLL